MNAPSITRPQRIAAMKTAMAELERAGAALRGALRDSNDERHQAFFAPVLERLSAIIANERDGITLLLADDLANIRSAVRRLRLPDIDPELEAPTPALMGLRGARGNLTEAIDTALEAAAALRLRPRHSEFGHLYVERHEIAEQLIRLDERLRAVQDTVGDLRAAAAAIDAVPGAAPAGQSELVEVHVRTLTLEAAAARFETATGPHAPSDVDMSALTRSVEAMHEMGGDLKQAIEGLTAIMAVTVRAVGAVVVRTVERSWRGLRTVVRLVRRKLEPEAAAQSPQRPNNRLHPHPEEPRGARRLEGWQQSPRVHPSFETRPAAAPQDKAEPYSALELPIDGSESSRASPFQDALPGHFPQQPVEGDPGAHTLGVGLFVPGNRFRDFDFAPEMIVVPAGEFMMGSPDGQGQDDSERPRHRVRIAKSFAVGVCPVTRGEFAVFVRATNEERGDRWRDPGFAQQDDHPVVDVSWHDAQAYVAWLNARLGATLYRLPSEAEWEYGCRAGTTTAYSTEDRITPGQGNFGRVYNGTTPVKRFPANVWGLYDMHGNVWEWCEDCWNGSYHGAPTDGKAWTTGDCSVRVVRGGSWNYDPSDLRAAARNSIRPDLRYDVVGFRVARTLSPPTP